MTTPTDVSTDLAGRSAQDPASTLTPGRLRMIVAALGFGGVAIGTTEFVTMGLIREIAGGVGVSIPTAGHIISAYALGVVVGAPLLAFFGAKWPRRALLIALMAAYAVFNVLSALATSFELLALARFLDGLPHGAYFGVASLVAASLAPPHRKGRAVASVMLGLSFANVAGVPAATWLGQNLGWRSAFAATAVLSVVTVALLWALLPSVPGDREATGRRELSAFAKPQVWLTLLAGALGFGGMFAVYSYIAPTITEVGGLGDGAVPIFLLTFGLGMVGGTWLAGELAGWSVFGSLYVGALGMAGALLLFWLTTPAGLLALPVAFAITALGSVLVVNLQLRLMDVAGDAQTLGAAMNHSALNLANALGAWLGGIVIAAGLGLRAPALVGVGLSLLGLVVLVVSDVVQRRSDAADDAAAERARASSEATHSSSITS